MLSRLGDQDEQALVAEAQAVRETRRRRDIALSEGERLERLHVLCAELAALARASEHGAP
jgi:hypothetical protein